MKNQEIHEEVLLRYKRLIKEEKLLCEKESVLKKKYNMLPCDENLKQLQHVASLLQKNREKSQSLGQEILDMYDKGK